MDRFNTFKLFLETNRKRIIISIIILLIMFVSTIMFLNIDKKVKIKTESQVFANLNIKDTNELSSVDNLEYYYVDIKGEVNLPGVYSLEKGKRVIDAINIAGGLTDNADTTLINQSIELKDQMVIIIYSKDEVNNIETIQENINLKEEKCHIEIKNDDCICNNIETTIVPDINNKNENINENKDTNDDSNIDINKNTSNEKININTATKDILMTIPKIGEVKAKAIISYRDTNNKFNNIEEIKLVKGIGESLFETIKDYITI